MKRRPCSGVLELAAAMMANVALASEQVSPRGPADIVRDLTYQSDRPDKHKTIRGRFRVFSCGSSLAEDHDNRQLTRQLVAAGSLALPAIEAALASLEESGDQSPFATNMSWLMVAYARIKGSAALGRLQGMLRSPVLAEHAYAVDDAAALAFGLTSYLSVYQATELTAGHACDSPGIRSFSLTPCAPPSREVPRQSFRCDRGGEPRDALNRFILAWEAGNRFYLGSSLGPKAKASLDRLVGRYSWTRFRSRYWPKKNSPDVAVGYRFEVVGPWSEPEETL